MSTTKGSTFPTPGAIVQSVAVQRRRTSLTGWRLVAAFAVGIAVVSLVRIVTGATQIDSSGTIGAAIGLAIPLGMAGLGGLWSERSGVVNIGLEGMMILGTWGAGWAGSLWGPWTGLLVGALMGAAGALIHAVATVTFGVDQIVSGVAINLLALGVTQYLSAVAFVDQPTQSPEIPSLGTLTIPGVANVAESVENLGWFFVSDFAGIVRAVTFQVPYSTILAVLLLPLTFFLLWRTAFGLRLRSCGEAPHAAESLGVNVYFYKYVGVTVSGLLAGFGGAVLATVATGFYREGQTAGLGFIGLAAMIFGNWRVGGLAAGSALFGYTQAMQLRSGDAVHALLLVVFVFLIGFAVWSFWRRRITSGIVSLLFGVLSLAWFLTTTELPGQVTYVTPYVVTLLVLSLASQRLRMPAADGIPYRRGESR